MVELDVRALPPKIAEASKIVRRAEARECEEIANQVRLIKIAVIQGDLRPIGRGNARQQTQDTLEAQDAIKEFRFQIYLEPEHIEESPITVPLEPVHEPGRANWIAQAHQALGQPPRDASAPK
jgi:hypothetical protein